MRSVAQPPQAELIAEFVHGEPESLVEFRWHATRTPVRVSRHEEAILLDLGPLRLSLPASTANQLAKHIVAASWETRP